MNSLRGLLLVVVALGLGACEEQSADNNDTAVVEQAKPAVAWPATEGATPESPDPDTTHWPLKNYYVVFDASGSMGENECTNGGTKLEAAKAALRQFAQSVPANANLGLEVFDAQDVAEHLPLGADNREQFDAAVDAVRAGGGTPLKSAIAQGYAALSRQGQRQLGYGEYHLVVVTDGEASGGEDPGSIVDQVLAESPVVLHTIGFCIGQDHSLNQPGRVLYQSADNPEELAKGLSDVLAEAPSFDVADFK
jgi:Ca-activated chloride channel homolog